MANDYPSLAQLMDGLRLLADGAVPPGDGRGVRVALIDTGVDRAALARRCAERGVPLPRLEGAIFLPGQPTPLAYQGRHSAPHGTTVAEILVGQAPGVELFSADIFGPRGISELDTLIHAVNYVRDTWRAQVINISLGISESQLQTLARREALRRAIEACYHAGQVVVAAAHQDHPATRSYPALFATAVVPVRADGTGQATGWRFDPDHEIEFTSAGRAPAAAATASSWAAPLVAGIIARWLSVCPDLRPFEIKALLRRLAPHPAAGSARPSPPAAH